MGAQALSRIGVVSCLAALVGCGGGESTAGFTPVDIDNRPPTLPTGLVMGHSIIDAFWEAPLSGRVFQVRKQGPESPGTVRIDSIRYAGSEVGWISSATLQGDTAPTFIEVEFDNTSLPPGAHTAYLDVVPDSGVAAQGRIDVRVFVNARPVTIVDSIFWILQADSVHRDSVWIEREGAGPMGSVDVTTSDGTPWIVTSLRDSLPGFVDITIDGTGQSGPQAIASTTLSGSTLGSGSSGFHSSVTFESPPSERHDYGLKCWHTIERVCMEARVLRWADPGGDLVALEVRNRQGSAPPGWDRHMEAFTASEFGIAWPGQVFSATPTYLGVVQNGIVLKYVNDPRPPLWKNISTGGALAVEHSNGLIYVLGCGGRLPYFGTSGPWMSRHTCPTEGFTGWLRWLFRLPAGDVIDLTAAGLYYEGTPRGSIAHGHIRCTPFGTECATVPQP